MRTALKVATVVTVLCLAPLIEKRAAEAGKVEGVGIGAGVGAVVAGPVGAVVGGVIGYKVGGPNLIPRQHTRCWRDDAGHRHCRRR